MKNSVCIQVSAIGLLLAMGVLPCGTEDSLGGQSEGGIIRGQGVLVPAGYQEIRCLSEEPRLVLFAAKPGQMAKAGDLLVELDAFPLMQKSEEQQIRLMKAEAELAAAEMSVPSARQVAEGTVALAEKALHITEQQLEAYRTAEYPTQQVAAKNEVAIIGERAAMLKQRVDEREAAYKEQANTELTRELQEVRLAFSQAQMETELATNRLKLLKDIEYPRRLGEFELVIAQRKLDLLRAQNELAQITQEGKASLEIAKAIRRMERERVERLEEQIASCKLYAPRDGTVFSSNDAALGAPCEAGPQPGDMVRPGQMLLRLADLTQLNLEVRLPLLPAQKLAPGREATVCLDAFPKRTYGGHIINMRILKDSDAAGPRTEALVTIRLDDPVKNFRSGMTATAEFDVPN